jgi:hypothetical protein
MQLEKVVNLKHMIAEARLHQIQVILDSAKDGHLTKRKRYQIAKLLMSLPSPLLKFAVQYLRTIQSNRQNR